MNAVIYARYSSDKQSEDSIEAQVRACREYAAKNDLNVLCVYADEAISGKTANRAQYQKMLRDCDKGLFDTILIHKYDRIARNLGEHVNLEMKLKEKGVALIATAQDFGNSKESKSCAPSCGLYLNTIWTTFLLKQRRGTRKQPLRGCIMAGMRLLVMTW